MIVSSGDVGIKVLMELCYGMLDGKGIPENWATSVAIYIFKGKGDTMNCGMCWGVELIEHAIKIVEKVPEKRLIKIVVIDDMQFGHMPGRCTIDVVFILRRIQEECLAKQRKLCMCFVDLVKAFDSVPRKVVQWTMKKKRIPQAFVRAVMSQYKGVRTKVYVRTHFRKSLK